jgi:dTDP-4-amino-4,6-dideoxygalactose transaminase
MKRTKTLPERSTLKIPFNKAAMAGNELKYIVEAVKRGEIKGDGPFTHKCNAWMEKAFGAKKALITTSCTSALEMAAILCDIQPGDEVIMPSFTFVSTANAFVIRGAIPVFADIREDTLNINETKIEERITARTKALCPVHYAGVSCEMDAILALSCKRRLFVVEDAAQGMMAKYRGKPLGTLGDFGAYSFHETKNFSSGEGGALLVNKTEFVERAEIIREKGTNRSKFFRGEVDRYTWVDIGSSYLPSEIIAAFLFAQFEKAGQIHKKRMALWHGYYDSLKDLETAGKARLPVIPKGCEHNGHIFHLILESAAVQAKLIDFLKSLGILSVFHYVPLHLSPMGEKFGFRKGDFPITEDLSARLVRLPLFYSLKAFEQEMVVKAVRRFFSA